MNSRRMAVSRSSSNPLPWHVFQQPFQLAVREDRDLFLFHLGRVDPLHRRGLDLAFPLQPTEELHQGGVSLVGGGRSAGVENVGEEGADGVCGDAVHL